MLSEVLEVKVRKKKKIGPVTVRRPRLYARTPPIQNLGTCLHKMARARVHVHVACPPLFLEFSPTPNFGVKYFCLVDLTAGIELESFSQQFD